MNAQHAYLFAARSRRGPPRYKYDRASSSLMHGLDSGGATTGETPQKAQDKKRRKRGLPREKYNNKQQATRERQPCRALQKKRERDVLVMCSAPAGSLKAGTLFGESRTPPSPFIAARRTATWISPSPPTPTPPTSRKQQAQPHNASLRGGRPATPAGPGWVGWASAGVRHADRRGGRFLWRFMERETHAGKRPNAGPPDSTLTNTWKRGGLGLGDDDDDGMRRPHFVRSWDHAARPLPL